MHVTRLCPKRGGGAITICNPVKRFVFDGIQGKRLVKIIPFNHPLSPADLEQLKQELKARVNDERDILLVCLGKELSCDGQVFNLALTDLPEKKTDLVTGSYTFPAPAGNTTVAVKIIDMLGEEVLVIAEV